MPSEDWTKIYESWWSMREEVFNTILTDERSLSRALALFYDFELNNTLVFHGEAYRYTPAPHPHDPLSAVELAVPMIAHGQQFRGTSYLSLRIDRFLAHMSHGKDCIIELGSGYGHKLFSMWLVGATKHAKYIAAESSASGRRLAKQLAALEPELNMEAFDFDFRAPNLPDTSGAHDILLFTSWSLMYAQPFNSALLNQIAASQSNITCVFIEPFGFQLARTDPDSKRREWKMNELGYNTDFYDKLCAAEKEGALDIISSAVDVFGESDHPLQRATIIVAHHSGATPPSI